MRDILTAGAYDPCGPGTGTGSLQASPAQYWHDTLNHTAFLAGSHYLAIVNNELEEKEPLYK